ncbi:MAG: heavy-metal-associated domain-containing protein [Chitinophagaceae bacterium]|nr:MAG: heavy-metal-associated domain-containing protein [Chitinophagaceae bacterium]
MKKLLKYSAFTLFFIIMYSTSLQAQRNVAEVDIKSSVLCKTCEKIILEALAFERGVRSAEVDIENKIITVRYNERRTDIDQIREAISKVGYDADHVKADAEAYKNLPFCCKIESGVH